jgi:hypothetical protein
MEYNTDPSPDMKRKILASWGSIFPFTSDPPVLHGQAHRGALGFWLCAKGGQVSRVSGKDWAAAYPPRIKPTIGLGKTAMDAQKLGTSGGRIVIGFSKVKGEADLKRIEAYVPDLITEVLTPELPGSGWTIGRFGRGRYVSDSGMVFDERSVMIVIGGITTEKLRQVAKVLARHLGQECVLVFDDNTGETWLVGQDEPAAPEAQ